MPAQNLYHDYIEGNLVPYLYVLTFQPCELNWDKPIYYFNLIKPADYYDYEHFDESIISANIYLSDLVINQDKRGEIGIHLNSIKNRIMKYGIDPDVVRQLILPTSELSEFLFLLPNERKIEFQIS